MDSPGGPLAISQARREISSPDGCVCPHLTRAHDVLLDYDRLRRHDTAKLAGTRARLGFAVTL